MNLRKDKKKNGRVYLSIGRGYRDADGKVKSATVKSLGYVDELMAEHPDPVAHFEAEVTRMNEAEAAEKKPEMIPFDRQKRLAPGTTARNVGYAAFSAIYHELGIDMFLNNRQRGLKAGYNINSIMKLLVYSRILRPGSKKSAYEGRGWFFDKADFSLDDLYRSLDRICGFGEALQLWMHERILANYGRDTTFVYYDVTNYYFEIDEEDEMRRRGVSKEHRPDPIVQMGLFMDNDGIPMSYRLFPGNNNDCTMLVPHMAAIRQKYDAGKMAVVADKGMNTAKNAYYIANGRGWYIFSQTVRGGSDELKEYVLKDAGYVWEGEDYKRKSRQFTRRAKIDMGDGNPPKPIKISEKQVVFYSRDYDRRAKRDREKAVQKAKDIIEDPAGFSKHNTFGAAKYIDQLEFDAETGEIVETGSVLRFNYDRLKEDEKYDGYYLVVTNCYDKPDEWVIDKYRGLWQIEETFKVTKSDLEARPVFVSRKEHIEAHFLTCFVALTLVRLLQKKLGGKHSSTRLIDSLSKACYAHIDTNRYMGCYNDAVINDVGEALGIDFGLQYRTLMDIRKLVGDTKK